MIEPGATLTQIAAAATAPRRPEGGPESRSWHISVRPLRKRSGREAAAARCDRAAHQTCLVAVSSLLDAETSPPGDTVDPVWRSQRTPCFIACPVTLSATNQVSRASDKLTCCTYTAQETGNKPGNAAASREFVVHSRSDVCEQCWPNTDCWTARSYYVGIRLALMTVRQCCIASTSDSLAYICITKTSSLHMSSVRDDSVT